jgi:hypothetical protein
MQMQEAHLPEGSIWVADQWIRDPSQKNGIWARSSSFILFIVEAKSQPSIQAELSNEHHVLRGSGTEGSVLLIEYT